ncbi:hypothetical protein CQJ30_08500 [Caldibacillus thermoamylovorans]|uniref:polysaccharide deacetylase family protein n=1 Tax=Caldibacillus thermoamylovorans TaxID=35841 RepID=UPI000D55CB20|nr:polysaccharide deacetylase family protein [Caldibacillus thermoamylovorans]AWI12197.1 hypothetical protein CQJ30_08500 [Caldibacillus thermoamylovorans]
MGKYTYQKLSALIIIGFLSFLIVKNPLSDAYVEKLRSDAMTVSSVKDALLIEIEEKSAQYEVPPQDAKIDRVWKKMPGYNGLKVDIDASYDKMKEDGVFDENKLIFKQVSPKVHLEDLPPAPIYRGHPDKPMIALTINVAWGNEYLSSILATLKKHNIQATFFLEGRWAKENPDLVKMIDEGGHEIGNHSYSHPDMKTLSNDRTKKELADTNEIIRATIGKTPALFAPPSGSYHDKTVEIANDMDMKTIMWTVDTIDWRDPPVSTLLNRVLKQLHNGAIILAHPTRSTDAALEKLLTEINEKGYKIGTVSNLLDEKRLNYRTSESGS